MKYQRTQIALDPEEHRRLVKEAAERGISLAEHLRQIVATRTAGQAAPYDARSWDALFDIADGPEVKDDHDTDAEALDAFASEYRRDMGKPPRKPRRGKP